MKNMELRVSSHHPAVAILPEGVTRQLCHCLVGTFLPTKINFEDTDKKNRKYVTAVHSAGGGEQEGVR